MRQQVQSPSTIRHDAAASFRPLFAALAMAFTTLAANASESVVTVGILTDMSGQMADYVGPGAVEAAKEAVADFGGTVNGKPIKVVFADHQLKPDVALGILRRWYDTEGVDAVVDLSTSTIALAAQDLTNRSNKVALLTSPAALELYREKCSANTVVWSVDNYTYGHAVPEMIMKQGGKKWFLLVTDYAFGHNLQTLVTETVTANGGQIVSAVRHPFNTLDYSSFLLKAQSSGADVVGFLNSNLDLASSLKQAREYGLNRNARFVAPANAYHSVRALGLEAAQGMTVVDPMYWDLNAKTREFSKRFQGVMKTPPTGGHFLVYAAVTHYLKGVQAAGSSVDGAAVVKKMKELPVSDVAFQGSVRADGRVLYDMLVSTVKSPAESKGPYDIYNVIGRIPAKDAFAPMAGSPCALAK